MAYNGFIKEIKNNIYKISYPLNTALKLIPINQFTELEDPSYNKFDYEYYSKSIQVVNPNNEVINVDGTNGGEVVLDMPGTYLIRYSGTNRYYSNDIVTGAKPHRDSNYSFRYTISVIENHLPLKKWTVTDVINRLLDVCEPIRKCEVTRPFSVLLIGFLIFWRRHKEK